MFIKNNFFTLTSKSICRTINKKTYDQRIDNDGKNYTLFREIFMLKSKIHLYLKLLMSFLPTISALNPKEFLAFLKSQK